MTLLTELKGGVGQLREGSEHLAEGVAAYTEGVDQLADGAVQLEEGAGELSGSGQDLADGYGALFEGIETLKDALKSFDEKGIMKLTDVGGKDLLAVAEGLRAVRKADAVRETFSGAPAGTESKVQYLIETEGID